MREIKKIHTARFAPIGDLVTRSPMPSASLENIDPFLFLNHHGPQHYEPNNNGLPFGPHPHRGMETVTFIIEGDIMHKDSSGHESVINEGGVQWMTAGKGLIHAEESSQEFKKNGGDLEILQLWVNLPAKLKMTEPHYVGLQKSDIPEVPISGGKINLISGQLADFSGAFNTPTDVFLSTVYLSKGAKLILEIPEHRNIFFYMIRGEVSVNGSKASMFQLVEFSNKGAELSIECITDCIILLGHAEPFNENIVAQGPFVMNTEEEILNAYDDYKAGKFGSWKF